MFRILQVNQAQKQRRRTYRAHGRINPYMCSPSHIELILKEKETPVPAEKPPAGKSKAHVVARNRRLGKKILASGTTSAAQ